MSEESDSSSSCESSDESPVEISEIPLPSCSNRARRIPPKKPPRLPLTLPVSLPFRWKTTSRRGPPNILQTVQQNPNVNVNLQDVKCKSININIVNNIGVPNLDVGKSNSSPDVSEHRSSSKKLRKSKRISGYSRNELKFNDKNAIEPPTPNYSGRKCLVLVKNVNDDTNDEPMESDSPIKHYKNRKKCSKVSKKVEKHTDTENSCTFLNNINNLNDNKIVSPMKDNKDVERSEKVMKMTNIVKKDLGVELQNKTNNKSDLKTKPDSSTREEKSVEPDESETIDHGSQTDPILLVSDEVHEVLKNFDKHHVIENIRQNIFLPNDNDVIVITDNDTDVPVHKKKKKIDDSLMKFVVECSDKNKELVAEMYSSAYSEAFKMFHDDGWSAVWKIMIKAARLSGLKELIEVPATISNTPVVQSNTPVVQSNTPVVQSNTPVVQSNIPVVQSNTPVVQSNNTEVQSNTRVVQSNTPVVQSNTTVVQSNIPVVLSNTPVAQSNTRVVQSNTPVVQSNTPVVQSNTPVMQSNIPVVLSNTPIAQSNTRVVQSNTPIVQSNMPVVQSKIAVVQSTQQIAQSENRLGHLMNTTQVHHSCVNLLPPPPPPPLPCDDPPLPPMENSSPLENQRHPPLPAPPLPPPPLPTFAVSTPAYNVLQHKMLPQQLQPTHKFVIPRISPKTSHRNIFDEQHRKHSMQPVLRDYGPTPYTRPTTPRNMAVHRQNRVERVHKARHKLAQDWSRHQMLTANPAHNMDLGEHVMYAAQAPLPHLPPAYPNPTSMSREQMVMYEQHQTLLKQ